MSDVAPRLTEVLVAHHSNARLVVTSFDSGRFVPSSSQLASGWTIVDGFAVSPPLIRELSLPSVGFDEWYVFDELPGPTFTPEVFVSYIPFPLQEARDETDEWLSAAGERLWRQLDSFQPISYVARAHRDVVVSRRERFMQALCAPV